MDELAKRVQKAAESFLENEGLTDELDDDAAQVMLAWAVARAKAVATETAGLNDAEAEEAMYPQLKAIRRMMRRANKWLPRQHDMSMEERRQTFEQIVEQAAIMYGDAFTPPTTEQKQAFLQQENQPVDLAAALRRLFEPAKATVEDAAIPTRPEQPAVPSEITPPARLEDTPSTTGDPAIQIPDPAPLREKPTGVRQDSDHPQTIRPAAQSQPEQPEPETKEDRSFLSRAIDSIFGGGEDVHDQENDPQA